MREFFADLHIHIGWTEDRRPVKITASKNLTFRNIVEEAYHRKGLDIIGIIDAHSPGVQQEIQYYLEQGVIEELNDGGLSYNGLLILLGAEIEIKENGKKAAHFLVFLPYFNEMISFTNWLSKKMKNVQLSSQRLYVTTRELQDEVNRRGGLFIPAHIFTPFKSIYGSCCDNLEEVLDPSNIDAVELGLSSDTNLADKISELKNISFLTNSDAHSLPKIGREYNKILLQSPSFLEVKYALRRIKSRKVLQNYGLNPKLGKYFSSRCLDCDSIMSKYVTVCITCGSKKIVKGVSNRIDELATSSKPKHPSHRPLYIHQIPLEFIPKVGKKTLDKLLMHFGTEMNIIHHANKQELLTVIPEKVAENIILARSGLLNVHLGGGGVYGKILD